MQTIVGKGMPLCIVHLVHSPISVPTHVILHCIRPKKNIIYINIFPFTLSCIIHMYIRTMLIAVTRLQYKHVYRSCSKALITPPINLQVLFYMQDIPVICCSLCSYVSQQITATQSNIMLETDFANDGTVYIHMTYVLNMCIMHYNNIIN